MSACAPKGHARKPKPPPEPPVKALDIGAGDVTVYGSARAKDPSFTVRWDEGGFDAASGTVDTGDLKNPKGEIFQNGKAVSTYRADAGEAQRALERLDVTGGVQLRSADGKTTIKAPAAQYRGDVKLLRATGGVTASGQFGTLSGVPELWATPDLRLIGTPDMVLQKLKLPALAALAAAAPAASASLQQGRDYALDYKGSTSYVRDAAGDRITVRPLKGTEVIFKLASRGIVLRSAGSVVVTLMKGKDDKVQRMTSEGAVDVVQTTAAGTTRMKGDGSTYVAGNGSGTLDVGGPVTLVNESKGKDGLQTTVARGSRGRAILLDAPPKGTSGLKSATLSGGVTLDSKGTGDDPFRSTGDRLVYVPKADAAEVDLVGNVVLTRIARSKDAAGATVTNTVVSRGARAHAVLDPAPGADANPMRNATLTGGVAIDVSGSNGQTFKGTGERVVYTALGTGGRAVMTGDLKFSGDAPSFLADVQDADTAVVTIGKEGWERVDLDNSGGKPTTTTLSRKTLPPKPKPKGKGGPR